MLDILSIVLQINLYKFKHILFNSYKANIWYFWQSHWMIFADTHVCTIKTLKLS